jgi:hypothetical protein
MVVMDGGTLTIRPAYRQGSIRDWISPQRNSLAGGGRSPLRCPILNSWRLLRLNHEPATDRRFEVYKPARSGEGMQPDTVQSELNQRRLRKERRDEDRQRADLQAKREAESKTPSGRLTAILDRFRIWSPRP